MTPHFERVRNQILTPLLERKQQQKPHLNIGAVIGCKIYGL
jgi:hypothetical protein